MSKEKQRQFDEINRPRNEELFNNIHKQYQELAKVKTKDEQIEEMANDLYENRPYKDLWLEDAEDIANILYNAGCRKQSEPFSCDHEKGSEWISVEERLPEKYGQYLCFRNGYICIRGFALNLKKIDEYDFCYADYSGWYDYDNEYGYFEVTRVTHWMPIPPPPKENKND